LGSWLRGQIEPKLVHGLIISVAPPPRPCGARSSGSQSAASGGLRLSAARPQPYPHSGAASAGPCSVIILARGTRNSYSHHSGHPAGPPLSSQPPQSAAEPAHQGQSPAPQRATESPIHQHPNLISCRESSGNLDRKNSTRWFTYFRTRPLFGTLMKTDGQEIGIDRGK
jgi:hypothetical protein